LNDEIISSTYRVKYTLIGVKKLNRVLRHWHYPISFTSAVTNHAASDAAGDVIGTETNSFWRDHKSSKVNAIRTKWMVQPWPGRKRQSKWLKYYSM
jgi:hypothetical protein